MEIKIKENRSGKSRSGISSLIGSAGAFWNRRYREFFVILAVGVLVWGGFFWYESLYGSAWTAEEKEAYRASKDKGINFQQDAFSEALKIVEERKVRYMEGQPEIIELFGGF